MKKIVALLIIAATWYFGGMNQHAPMMTAIICGMIFILLSFILSRIMRHNISADIPPQKNVTYKNIETTFFIHAQNKGYLPVNRFRLNFFMKYRTEKHKSKKRLNGSASGKRYNEENLSEFYFIAPYCGIIDIELTRIRAYDYLMLFSSSKRLKNTKSEILVLPQPKEMHIIMPPFGSYTNDPVAESSSDVSGDDHSEIRLVREYRPGDLTRHLHRNYSARTEKLWIKEYQKENDFIFDFLLDTSSDTPLKTDEMDAFYEIIMSVLHTILQNDVIIRVHFYDKNKGGIRTIQISHADKTKELICELYRTNTICNSEEFRMFRGNLGDNGMIINAKLEWYFNNNCIYSFNKEIIEHELVNNIFDLR